MCHPLIGVDISIVPGKPLQPPERGRDRAAASQAMRCLGGKVEKSKTDRKGEMETKPQTVMIEVEYKTDEHISIWTQRGSE